MSSIVAKSARASVRRAVSISLPSTQARTITSSVVSQKDFVQDLYLKELSSYAPPPPPKDAHLAHVKPLRLPTKQTLPSIFQSPEIPTLSSLAGELDTYDKGGPSSLGVQQQQQPQDAAGEKKGGEDGGKQEKGGNVDSFLEELRTPYPAKEEHHH